jgi:hypothetical protein
MKCKHYLQPIKENEYDLLLIIHAKSFIQSDLTRLVAGFIAAFNNCG